MPRDEVYPPVYNRGVASENNPVDYHRVRILVTGPQLLYLLPL